MDDYQMFKIVIIGSVNTGKTNIATKYIRNEFNPASKATVGVEFLSKMVTVNKNHKLKVTLWDTAGQEQYKSLGKVYYKGASGVLVVYDVCDPKSYLDVQSWLKLANQNLNLNSVVLTIVGNKADMESERRVLTERPIKDYSQKFGIDCWEVSAKTGYNIKQLFADMLEKIYGKSIEIDPFQTENPGESVVQPISVISKKDQTEVVPVQQIIEELIVTPIAIKKKPQVTKSHRMTLADQQKKRAKQKGEKKKGCC